MLTHLTPRTRVFVDAGHHEIALPNAATRPGELIDGPTGPLMALTTSASLRTFQQGVEEFLKLRARGVDSALGVLIGDLAVPHTSRPTSTESLAPSFRSVLATHGLSTHDVHWMSEATARNRGRKLVDKTRHRYAGSQHTYQNFGWAFCSDGEVLAIVSDRTLEGTDGLTIAVLTRGQHTLCPTILLGYKHFIARAGYTEHKAFYSQIDDPFIGGKLWAAALVVEALSGDGPKLEVHDHIMETAQDGSHRIWRAKRSELIGCGEVTLIYIEMDLQQMNHNFILI